MTYKTRQNFFFFLRNKIFKENRYGEMAKRDRFLDIKKNFNVENPIIIDGGAHKGECISIFKSLFNKATIYSFEPIPELASELKQKYLNDNSVHIVPKALGKSNENIIFNIYKFSGASSALNPSDWNYKSHKNKDIASISKKITVEQIRLDSFIDRIDILKLDIQGYEIEALEGAANILDSIKIINPEVEFTELYNNQPLFGDIDIFLRKHDFKLLNLYDLWTHESGQLTSGDAIYLNKRYYS